MIKSLKLTNFRAVRSADMTFDAGMVCLKGANEASKSTRLEAIQYALFGSSALRTNFADAVTYGESESTLKVECNAVFGGRAVTFKRGKSGAEVIETGNVIVTGQKEVALFAANLMGADAAAASNLLIANQGSLRGVLEQGPKATSQFVEQLANFDLFDTLLRRLDAGERPAVPADAAWPVTYVRCMRRCWAGDAAARPSFSAMVSLLPAGAGDEEGWSLIRCSHRV